MEVLLWILGIIIFLISLLVFIGLHELGHASVARLFKLEVPKFFVGFGKTIWSKRTKGHKIVYREALADDELHTLSREGSKHKRKKIELEVVEPNVFLGSMADAHLSNPYAKQNNNYVNLAETSHALEQLATRPDIGYTEYGLKAIPAGGFVMIEDPNAEPNSYERMGLSRVHPFKRILVFLAGPLVNIILGIAILMSVFMIYPADYTSNQIKKVETCTSAALKGSSCAASESGLKNGDTVHSIGGKQITEFEDFAKLLVDKDYVSMEVVRDGKIVEIPQANVANGKLGIIMKTKQRNVSAEKSWEAIVVIMDMNVKSLVRIYEKVPLLVDHLFKGEARDPETPSSIVAVGKVYGDTAASSEIPTKSKVQTLLTYAGLFNLGIGFINILPILPLDGGRIAISLFDWVKMGTMKVRRKQYNPLSATAIARITLVAISVLGIFFLLVVASDLLGMAQGTM